MREHMTYWFRQKRYGLGATPVSRQGWLAIAIFGLITAGIGLLVPLGPLVAILIASALGGFLWLCHAKTEHGWRWRWGGQQ